MRRKLKKLRRLNKLRNHKKYKYDKKPIIATSSPSIKKIVGVGLVAIGLLVIITIAIGIVTSKQTISVFSGKAYLKSLGVDSSSKYENNILETYNLEVFEGVVLGRSKLNGENRFIFCVNKDGVVSYDTEITEVQGEIVLSSEYLNNGKVTVYNRFYENNEGKKVKTYYYKIYCDISQVKDMNI